MAANKLFSFVARGTISNGNIKAKLEGDVTGPEGALNTDQDRVIQALKTCEKSHPDFVPTKISVSRRVSRPNGSSFKETFIEEFDEATIRHYRELRA